MVMSDRIKFEMEFPIKVSQKLLFQYLSTPSGLSEWFADNVNSRGENFTFIWDDGEEYAKMISKKPNKLVRFQTLTLLFLFYKICNDCLDLSYLSKRIIYFINFIITNSFFSLPI